MRSKQHLNKAKFFRPLIGPDIVERNRLWDYLDHGYQLPLTLVSAPAGYGKSTLVSSWLDQRGSKYVWLSLDKEDSDLTIFLRNFIRGIRKLHPDFGYRLEALLETPQPTSIEKISSEFINSLTQLDHKVILVMDDYHMIANQDIHELISNYLKYPNKDLHVLLCTRSDPPIRIQEIRSKGWLQDIRARDLIFNQEEILEFLGSKNIGQLSDIDLKNIHKITNGWPTGVRLLTFQNGGTEPFKKRLLEYGRSDLFYLDIIKNYLEKNEALKEFVLIISCLSQFNYDLCNHIISGLKIESDDAKTMIFKLINDNFFIIPLDDNNYRFRFHHLIQSHLYKQLQSFRGLNKISRIHCIAANWYKDHNQPKLAIEQYIKGLDFERALDVFKEYRLQLHKEMNWSTLENILKQFPDNYSKTSPELLLTKAWLLIYSGNVFEMFSMLGQIEASISDNELVSKELKAEWKSLQVYEIYNISQDYHKCIEACSFAIEHLPKEHVYALGYAWIFLGGSLQITDNTTAAVQRVKKGIAETDDITVRSHQWLVICYMYWISGKNEFLIQSSQSLIELGLKSNNMEALANGYKFRGITYFAQGNFDEAKEFLLKFYELRYSTIGVIHFMGMVALAKSLFLLGEDAQLQSKLDDMAQLVNTQSDNYFSQLLTILRAEISLSKGHNKLAITQINKLGEVAMTPLTDFYCPHIIMARILLNSDSEADIQNANTLINQLEDLIYSTQNGRFVVDLLLLKSESALRSEEQKLAESYAEKAIKIANIQGYISPFLEISNSLLEIVKSISKLKYRGFYEPLFTLQEDLKSENNSQIPSVREMEVFNLLKENLTNKQIANALYISEKTVKRHCGNLFKKLGVKNRREAIMKWQDFDLAH